MNSYKRCRTNDTGLGEPRNRISADFRLTGHSRSCPFLKTSTIQTKEVVKIIKKCPVCNNEVTNTRNKYCSVSCRNESVKERDRLRKREERKAEREIIKREASETHKKKLAQQRQEAEKRQEKSRIKLKERAEQGDNLALMNLAEPNSYEYWQAYRDYELEQMEEYEKPRVMHVNDISVFDDNFSEKVVSSIKEQGRVSTHLLTV